MDKLLKEMQRIYDISMKENIDYVMQRKGLCEDQGIKTKRDARNYLQDVNTDGDYENTARECGYLSGYADAIHIVKMFLENNT